MSELPHENKEQETTKADLKTQLGIESKEHQDKTENPPQGNTWPNIEVK